MFKDDRLAIEEIPKIDGMVTTLEEMAWQGITLDLSLIHI